MKYKIGDKVVKARRYSDSKYCGYGGDESSVPIGTEGTVTSVVSSTEVAVGFDTGSNWSVDVKEIEHVKGYKAKKVKADDRVRYMVYGTECENKGNLVKTESDLKIDLKSYAKDSSWTGDIIGYKLTPIYQAEKSVTIKSFAKVKIKK